MNHSTWLMYLTLILLLQNHKSIMFLYLLYQMSKFNKKETF
ncbi:MAG: hypothetical protein ETSY1_47065 (plasmid) [Candidatus Entotheonella factor]|uniref:Uncharacterized protein n=1 Tax=Entotheonella factor TaxID=1429438 RepID=W4LZZ8_ENTF1|nr:MAG: hypothetical protein ETSY1_47065 [Candidatus Entotheonella factor]